MTFLLIKRDSVFAGLNFTSQVFAHCVIFSRCEFNVSATVSGFSPTRKRRVSSANSLMFEPISFQYHLYTEEITVDQEWRPVGLSYKCSSNQTVCLEG